MKSTDIEIGRRVRLDVDVGTVVADIGRAHYGGKYTQSDWEYLGNGILVEFDAIGLVHFEDVPEETRLA